MVCKDAICIFDEKQRHSNDPRLLLAMVGAFDQNIGSRVDNRVFWPAVLRQVCKRLLKFEPFGHNVIPSILAKLFRVVATFAPAYVVQAE